MGNQKITGRNSSILNNIEYKGFSSKDSLGRIVRTLEGKRTIDEKFQYKFERISTSPYINKENKKLQYWRQLDGGVWMSDAESGNGTSHTKLDKDAYFVLVLDASSSLGDDFRDVKDGAKFFIEEMYKASSDGNIRIGIICFSTMDDTKILDITPLTYSSKSKMQNFIENQYNSRKATSMYYSINKGIEMLDHYVNNMISKEDYEGTHIITFTDGLDNTSQLYEEELYSANEVYEHVKNKLKNKKIRENLIDSWVIGVKGVDVQKVQLDMMKSQLESLASSKSQFKFLNNISELIDTFSGIARNLTEQWKNLSCTSALNHNGLVCWTLGEKPKVKKHMLLGINIGFGFGVHSCEYTTRTTHYNNNYNNDYYYNNYYDNYYGYGYDNDNSYTVTEKHFITNIGYKMDFGLDFAYPITTKFGLGFYFSGFFDTGYVRSYYGDGYKNFTDGGLSVGLLTTIGNYHEKAALLAGLGCNLDFGEGPNADIRLGVLFNKGIYLMTTISTGFTPYAMTFNIGYNFGALFNVK